MHFLSKFTAWFCSSLLTGGVSPHANCTDVHLVFARGTTQAVGLGTVGTPLFEQLAKSLPHKTLSAYAVDYTASTHQLSAGCGATDMTKHIEWYADACPKTDFVIGGFSQGAYVTDIAIGVKTLLRFGDVIPCKLEPRIKAVVTFGNPLRLTGRLVANSSKAYGKKSIDFCNKGDPVCRNGRNVSAHSTYPTDSVPTAVLRIIEKLHVDHRNFRGANI